MGLDSSLTFCDPVSRLLKGGPSLRSRAPDGSSGSQKKTERKEKDGLVVKVVLANVPSFRFLYRRSVLCTLVPFFCALVLVFGTCRFFAPSFWFWGSREHLSRKKPFWKPPCLANPRKDGSSGSQFRMHRLHMLTDTWHA